MAYPGITKTVTLSNAWQRLGSVYDSNYPTTLVEGGAVANGCWISVKTYGMQIAFADDQPSAGVTQGHAFADGDSSQYMNQAFVKRAWVRNDTAGSNSILTITPIYE